MTGAPGRASAIAVVVCTRNHPQGAAATAGSILRADPDIELVVVDQSDVDEATRAVNACGDGRARVIREAPRGLAAARNAGVRACAAELIAFTDDDCLAASGWAAAFQTIFDADDRVAIAFGTVAAPDYDRSRGFVPAYQVQKPLTVDRLSRKCRIEGIGACMAVRRSAWECLGGFDEALGTGARLRAAEDTDFVVRALAGGWRAAETPDASVLHQGFRTWAQGRDLIEGYMVGLGAVNMKMLRLGGWRAVGPLAELAWRWLAGTPVVDLNQRPPRVARLAAFLRGAAAGRRLPLDAFGRFESPR